MARFPVANNVAEAAKHMDEYFPGWEKKINVTKLDLGDSNRCIIGQSIGKTTNIDSYGKHIDIMYADEDYVSYKLYSQNKFRKDWIKEIQERLNRNKSMKFAEALQELINGKKIRAKSWNKGSYWQRKSCNSNEIVWDNKVNGGSVVTSVLYSCEQEWEIYDERVSLYTLNAGDKFTVDGVVYIRAKNGNVGIYAFCPATNNVEEFGISTLVTKVI